MKNLILSLPLMLSFQSLMANPVPGEAVQGCTAGENGYTCTFDSGVCEYRPSVAMMFIDHCGRRNETTIFKNLADQDRCPSLYEFYNGIYLSREDWVLNTPCPELTNSPSADLP